MGTGGNEVFAQPMMEQQVLDEALKASNHMVWVRCVNGLMTMEEKMVLREIVYQ